MDRYLVLAYYHLAPIPDPAEEVRCHLQFLQERDVTCRIYLSAQGINGQMSASPQAAEQYMDWIRQRDPFLDIEFKLHAHHEHVFPRISVKSRAQLVAMDAEVDLKTRADPVSPEQWRQMLAQREEDTLLLDVRNEYEWKIGHFEGAILPAITSFRQFPAYAQELKRRVDPQRSRVMMYCTGGIRCEFYSALLKQEGFAHLYQLHGGVIQYGLAVGAEHWLGKLFVFDDRLVVPISEAHSAAIARCHHCEGASDTYYNCANMDCNALFLCCAECAAQHVGCCGAGCQLATRLRPFAYTPKPFRRSHF